MSIKKRSRNLKILTKLEDKQLYFLYICILYFVLNRKATSEQAMEDVTSWNLGKMKDWMGVKQLDENWEHNEDW